MLSDWWNGVELWIAGLPFPFQFALVIVVLVPLCLVVAWLIDRIVDHASAFFGPAEHPEPPLGVKLDESGADDVEAQEPAPEEPAEDKRVPAESTGR
jgi:hypothetical protein